VTLYITVISAMLATALASGNVLAAIGAALFVASDSMIAWDRFVHRLAWAPVAIMVTYHLGQAGLVASLLRGRRQTPPTVCAGGRASKTAPPGPNCWQELPTVGRGFGLTGRKSCQLLVGFWALSRCVVWGLGRPRNVSMPLHAFGRREFKGKL